MIISVNNSTIDYWDQCKPFINYWHSGPIQYSPPGGETLDFPLNRLTDGWPSSLPDVGGLVEKVLRFPQETPKTLIVTWTGNVTAMSFIGFTVNSINLPGRTASITFTGTVPNTENLVLQYTFTDTVNYPRDFLIKAAEDTGFWDPIYISKLQESTSVDGYIRNMKWIQNVESNNGNTAAFPGAQIHWASRNTLTGGDWRDNDGIPVEVLVDLGNTANRSIWISIPWNVDNAWITGVATYVRDHLNPSLKCHYECSNEVWNGSYPVYYQAVAEGTANGLPDGGAGGGYGAGVHRLAQRTFEMMSLVSAVYTGVLDRCVRVLCFQHANSWFSDVTLQWMHDQNYISVIDAIGSAPYFSQDDGVFGGTSIPTSYTGDKQAVFDICTLNINDFVIPNGLTHKTTATKWGLKYLTYEAGQSLLFTDQTYQRSIETDSRMYDTYSYYINQWATQVNVPLCMFVAVTPIGFTGGWGIREYEYQTTSKVTTPKFQAIVDFINAGIPIANNGHLDRVLGPQSLLGTATISQPPQIIPTPAPGTGKTHGPKKSHSQIIPQYWYRKY